MTGRVTALGIRDGDPAVLRALIARRGSAVLAYCERACAPAQVAQAAADAFARFRALVVAAPRPAELDPEAALLSCTRHATAERAPRGQAAPSGPGLGRLLGGRSLADQVGLVPELLIARAEATLDDDGEEQLNRLLDASAAARAAEERFRTAEHAYRSAPSRAIPPEIVDQIVDSMTSVPAPGEPAEEPAPAPAPAPAPTLVASGHVGGEGPRAARPPRAEEPRAGSRGAEERGAELPEPAPPPVEDEPPAPEPPPAEEPVPVAADPGPDPSVREPDEPDEPYEPEDDGPSAADEPDDSDDAPSEEWDVPPEHIGPEGALDVEIAAARLRHDDGDEEEEAAHLQSASGAVEEPLVPQARAQPQTRAAPPARAAAATQAAARRPPERPPRTPSRPSFPGRNALAPAAAVVAVAAVSILATSGILGGDEAQPPVDTGVAPKRTQVEVPEGEAAAVIDELRRAADRARRQRLADTAAAAPPDPPVEFPTPPANEQPAPEERQEETPAPAEPQGDAGEETPQDSGGQAPPADDAGDATPAPDGTPPEDQP